MVGGFMTPRLSYLCVWSRNRHEMRLCENPCWLCLPGFRNGVMSYSQELRKVILELTKAVVSKEGGFSEWRYSTPAGQDRWHPYGWCFLNLVNLKDGSHLKPKDHLSNTHGLPQLWGAIARAVARADRFVAPEHFHGSCRFFRPKLMGMGQ